MNSIIQLLDDCLSLVYPRLCLACHFEQPIHQELICTQCHYNLPKTQQYLDQENRFTQRFWGRVAINTGAAIFQFSQDSGVQRMLHNLKYKGRKDIGVRLGEEYGRKLKKMSHFQDVDYIIPVPLHPRKLRERGYNQSAAFAEGLSETMGKPFLMNGLRRIVYNKSLARSGVSRAERFQTIATAFQVKRIEKLRDAHVLLVDDVLTTGATLEACAIQLLENVTDIKVSMATIAMADNM